VWTDAGLIGQELQADPVRDAVRAGDPVLVLKIPQGDLAVGLGWSAGKVLVRKPCRA